MDSISKTRLYAIFSGMKQRCYNPNCDAYRFYGAKGIAICDEWMAEHGLTSFMEWALNNGYEEHLTIDRIDAKGPYSPDNCRWITQSENSKRVERETIIKRIPGPGIRYKIDILAELKKAGYSSTRIRNEKLMGQATLTQLRRGELVSWMNIETICRLLNCQPGDIMEYVEENAGE